MFDHARKRKRKSGPTAPVAGLDLARADAEAARLPDADLQLLLDRYRAGDTLARPELQRALTFVCFQVCDKLRQSFSFDRLSEHMLALNTCLDRLANNGIAAADLPRYIANEMTSQRKAAFTEHRVKVSKYDRTDFDDAEDLSWRNLDLDDERLDEQSREVARLLKSRCTFREICAELGITQHALYRIIDTIKRAAA